MLQEHVTVKQMPGRPNTQKPAQRVPLSQNGSFGPSPVNGKGCCPPLKDPPMRPFSVKQVNWRDVPEGNLIQNLVQLPRWTTAQEDLPLLKNEDKVNMATEDSHLFHRCPSRLPPRRTYTTMSSTWTTSSTLWA